MHYVQVAILSSTGEVKSVAVSSEEQDAGHIHQYEEGPDLDIYDFTINDPAPRRANFYMSRLEKSPGLDAIRFKATVPQGEKGEIASMVARKNMFNGRPR